MESIVQSGRAMTFISAMRRLGQSEIIMDSDSPFFATPDALTSDPIQGFIVGDPIAQ